MEYEVLNPRDIPAGIHVLEYDDQRWCAGDVFIKPRRMSDEDVKSLVARGFLRKKAVNNG